MTTSQSQLSFIDLFCGCGGFSLGMERAGFRCLAAIDFNPHAITVFKQNFPHVPQVLERDLTKFPPEQLAKLLDAKTVDVIVGGPPCQGFSRVRRVDGSNNGDRLVNDDRRFLYQDFLYYVEFFQPRVFVMENVPGIRTAVNGAFFSLVQRDARTMGYRVHAQQENAWELGVPQKRVRQLIIGTRLDLPEYFLPVLNPAPRASANPRLWQVIGDLPPLKAGAGEESCDYDMERRRAHLEQFGRRFIYEVLEVQRARKLTAHRARPHSDRDLRDFLRLKEGQSSADAMRQGVQFEFPYKKTHFKDRYTRQSRWEACSTIVAHICKEIGRASCRERV